MVPPSMLRRWTLWSYRFLINAFNRSEVIKSFISGEWYTVSSLKNAKCSRNFHCNIGVNHLWFSKDQEIWLFFKLCYIGSKFIKQQQYLCRFKIIFFFQFGALIRWKMQICDIFLWNPEALYFSLIDVFNSCF